MSATRSADDRERRRGAADPGRLRAIDPSSRWRLVAALGAVYLGTGTTFLAMKLVSSEIAPAPLTALRLVAAGLLLAPFATWRLRSGASDPTWREVRAAAVSGALLLTIGQTALVWGISRMPAGTSAVFASAAPLFVAVFSTVFLRKSLPRAQLLGVSLGFAGILTLTLAFPSGDVVGSGVIALLLSAASWAAGSLYGRSAALPEDAIVSLTCQLLIGGLLVTPLALLQAHSTGLDLAKLDGRVWGGLAYLVVAAIVAFQSFSWLNRNTSSAIANTFAYVAPVLALALSATLLGETVTALKIGAGVVTLAGVVLILR